MNIQKPLRVRAAVLVGLAVIFSPTSAIGRPLQILHTNDLHAHFDEAEDRSLAQDSTVKPGPTKGGIAQLKARIDQLKAEAAAEGIETLVVDTGDFTEGSQYYLADQGEQTWRLMDTIGYDAVALGNHDYYMGEKQLDQVMKNVDPKFPVLSANFTPPKSLKHLRSHVKPYIELKRAGVKIGLMGLVTNGLAWKWRTGKNVLRDPQRSFDTYIDELSDRNDYVILLSHLGQKADENLVSFSLGVDLVVGGHSHTFYKEKPTKKPDITKVEPIYVQDMFKKEIPIVQAGQHGEVIGRLMVDVQKGKPLKVKSFEYVHVYAGGPQDPVVAQAVQGAKQRMNDQFGDAWLHEVIGHTDIPMTVPKARPTVWGQLTNEAMRRVASADVAIDDVGGAIYGDNLPAGPITREKLFRYYARVFDVGERYGWTVWTVNARTWAFKIALKQAMDRGYEIKPEGVTYTAKHYWKYGWHISNLKLNGRKLGEFETLRIALPQGIAQALDQGGIIKGAQVLLHNPTDTGTPVWMALEMELARRGGVVR